MRANAISGQRTISDATVSAASNFLDRWALARIQRTVASAPLRFMLWDGFELPSACWPAGRDDRVQEPRARSSAGCGIPELNFGEAYMFGAVEIHGDLRARCSKRFTERWHQTARRGGCGRHPTTLPRREENVHHHYDLGNDFYRLWLDERWSTPARISRRRRRALEAGADREDGSRLPEAAA